jgi:hypothetical protein
MIPEGVGRSEEHQVNDERLKFLNHDMRNALGPIAIQIEILRAQGADPAAIEIMERQIAKQREIMSRMVPGEFKDV